MVGRETIKRTQDHRVADECSLPPGTVLGRYVIVRFIGGGGNADVYAAYDQLLQRTVALKILRGLGDAGQWETVLEEAQSLARLSHPNVVVVHDVGRQDEHVFISMELIDGDDLGTWLGGRKHRWRDIVSVFVAAGRGLAAAHEHGVVHGDFKPTNVLVDAAGRVRVVDFGLAAIDGSDGAGADPTQPEGTPGYMSPEQVDGKRPTARSDQFSFCLSLAEALTGKRPDFRSNGERLRFREFEGWRSLPPSIRRAVWRGLADDPEDRHRDMSRLLDALEAARRNRRWLLPVGVLSLTIGSAAWAAWPGAHKDRCEVDHELADVWSDDAQAAMMEAFAVSTLPYADDVGTTARRRLQAYARRWLTARAALCEAPMVDERTHVMRRLCLDARRAALGTAVDILSEGDEAVIGRAVDVVDGLPRIEECAQIELRHPRRETPSDGVIDESLANARVLGAAGRYSEALELAQRAADLTTGAGDLAGEAMARLQIAYLQSQMNLGRVENAYHDALRAAIAAQDFGLVAKSGASLAWEAADAADFERAHRWLAHATAASVAAGGEDDLVSYVDNARGHVHGAAGETEQEVAAFRRHLEATQRVHGLRSSPVATAQNNLAAALYRTGEYDEAASLGEQALEFARRELGPRHPSVVIYALTVSSCRADQGRLEEAIRLGREALDIARDVLGENHPNTLTVMNGLATILVYDGQYNRAIELHRKVLATWEGAGAPDSVKLAVSRGNLGLALWHAGELEEANDLLVRSLTELEANLGPTHPFTASARVWIADLRIDLGDAAEVIEGLEAAVVSESDGEASTRAAAQFALARALWETGGDRDRSLALAGDAHTATKATPDRMQAERIGDWLRERGRLPVEQTGDTGAEGRK